jgi:TRAP-type uncharacterized transport system substrate-binding protein
MARWRTKTTTLKNGTKVTKAVEGPPKEWRIQSAAVRALRAMPEFGRRFTIAADMAAHKRRPQDATIAKATGLVKGEADLRLYMEGGRLGLIEYKAAKGRLSPEQKDRAALLARLGFGYQAIVKATTEADAAMQTVSVVKGWLGIADNDNDPDAGWKHTRSLCS